MQEGSFVHVHLIEPTERFWGKLIKLTEAGVILRGIDVRQIEVFKYQFNKDERMVFPQTIFFPMRRIQKVDLDEPMDELPSVIDSVIRVSGVDEDSLLS